MKFKCEHFSIIIQTVFFKFENFTENDVNGYLDGERVGVLEN